MDLSPDEISFFLSTADRAASSLSSQFVSSSASCSKTSSYECLILSYAASLIAYKISIMALVGVSIRDETLHSLVAGDVGCHADAQWNVTRHPVDLVTVRRKLFCVEPTLEIKGGSIRIVALRFSHTNVLVVQTFEHRWSRMVHATRIDSMHTPRARALMCTQHRCFIP